jgi:AraC family transcriptional regulator
MAWVGLSGEIIQITRHEPLDYEFRDRWHLLLAYDRGSRDAGETFVEGLPPSCLRAFSQKLTFVPAGLRFRERQVPGVLLRAAVFYIDAKSPFLDFGTSIATGLAPRLFFEHNGLWQTVQKLKALVEAGASENANYAQALGAVLVQEIRQMNQGAPPAAAPMRGGLSGWQRRIVAQHIEEHLAASISLADLAKLARLSPFHFARAFKQSFGMPPHRYHTSRRIEQAKVLMATLSRSVTEIALDVGFSETSSFTAAFRKLTGQTPTAYRRSLA